MKKLLTVLLVTMLAVCVLSACGCKHEWVEADCNDPKTCSLCGETEGEDLGHDYAEPNCEHGKLCSRCGKEKGEALGHNWVDADCVNPITCSACGATEGEALGHDLSDATCTDAPICYVCGESVGEALGHTWVDADCVNPKTCADCGETEGEALGHTLSDATCTDAPVCSVCTQTVGEALGHTWLDATLEAPKTCSVCGATEGEPLSPTKEHLGYDLSSFVTLMDTSLQGLGSKMEYVGIDGDGNYVYKVLDNATGADLDIMISITLSGDYVYGVIGYTESGADSHISEVIGNCFGVVAVLADSTYTNADLQAMIAEPYQQTDTGIYYYYEKNGIGYLMALETQGDLAIITTAIAPLD